MFNTPEYSSTLSQNNIILSYKGNLTQELCKNIIQLVEVKLERVETNKTLKRKVIRILVEVIQNLYHHFEDKKLQKRKGSIYISLRKENSEYIIVSGNPISKRNEVELRERMDFINKLTSHEIKINYRESLSNKLFSAKGGAGLGLLDMLRKSGGKVDYKFQTFNNDYSFFNLKVKVSV